MVTELPESERAITASVDVGAPVGAVWEAWTTEAGVETFFAPDCSVDLRVGGPYEMYFAPDAPTGERGGDGNQVLAFQPETMLTVTWNAPPTLPEVRDQRTVLVVRFESLDADRTRVRLTHVGWGEGGQWDEAYDYLTSAWQDAVLPNLRRRFEAGPIDWAA